MTNLALHRNKFVDVKATFKLFWLSMIINDNKKPRQDAPAAVSDRP